MDENEGMGGSYVRDPKTGKRKLTERTNDQASKPADPKPSSADKE